MTEAALQTAVADYLRIQYRDRLLWFHPANERKCSPIQGARLKRHGVKAGVPDLVFILGDGRAMFIELKAGNGRQTNAQKAFEYAARTRGCEYHVCRSVEDVAAVVARCTALARESAT